MTMSVIGPMARTIDDIELGMRVMVDAKPWTLDSKCCPVPWRSVTLPASLNIGVIYDDGLTRPTSVVMQAFHQLCLALSAAGHNGEHLATCELTSNSISLGAPGIARRLLQSYRRDDSL